MNANLWQRFSTHPFAPGQMPALSKIAIPEGPPNIENQINAAQNEWICSFFRQFHLPMIERAGVSETDLRILEIGGGFGQLAYGTIHNVTPHYYVATDVFPELVSVMTGNFERWGRPNCFSALLDPNETEQYIKPASFNVIQSHSVMHHILHYDDAVERLYEKLDSPGVMIFCEPCLDAYVYLQTLTKAFRGVKRISQELETELGYLDIYIDQRTGGDRGNRKFLSQFGAGDKYLYSLYDLQKLSERLGAKLHISKDVRKAKGNFEFELKIRKANQADLDKFRKFLDDVLPAGVDEAYFSDLRQVFCLTKS